MKALQTRMPLTSPRAYRQCNDQPMISSTGLYPGSSSLRYIVIKFNTNTYQVVTVVLQPTVSPTFLLTRALHIPVYLLVFPPINVSER